MCVPPYTNRTLPQSRPSPLRDDHARFYAASVVCGLEYMQDRNLMWRCVCKRARNNLRSGDLGHALLCSRLRFHFSSSFCCS